MHRTYQHPEWRLPTILLFALLLFVAACQKSPTTHNQPISSSAVKTIVLNDITILSMDDSPHTFQSSVFADIDNYPDRKTMMPGGKFQAVVKTYLIKSLGRNILVDGGMGKESGVDGKTTELLMLNGLQPGDITDILLTHMDIDHIAGLIHEGKAVFQRATLRVSRVEYEAWMAGAVNRPADQIALAKRVSEAYSGRIQLFDFGDTVLPRIEAVDARGHTPGHTAFDITCEDKGLAIVGDLLHVYPIQLRYTDYCTIYDGTPSLAAASRERTLARLSKTDRLIAGMHFPMIGKVRQESAGGYSIIPE